MRQTAWALLGMVTLVMGCSGDNDGNNGPSTFAFQSGIYEYTPLSYAPNTCWTEAQAFPPILAFQFLVTTNVDDTFTLTGEGIAAGIFPEVSGTVDGNKIDAGPSSFTIDAREAEEADTDYSGLPGEGDCAIVFSMSLDGELTGTDTFDATLGVVVSEETSGGCSELYGDTLDIGLPVPFPDVETSGSCTLTPFGTGILQN